MNRFNSISEFNDYYEYHTFSITIYDLLNLITEGKLINNIPKNMNNFNLIIYSMTLLGFEYQNRIVDHSLILDKYNYDNNGSVETLTMMIVHHTKKFTIKSLPTDSNTNILSFTEYMKDLLQALSIIDNNGMINEEMLSIRAYRQSSLTIYDIMHLSAWSQILTKDDTVNALILVPKENVKIIRNLKLSSDTINRHIIKDVRQNKAVCLIKSDRPKVHFMKHIREEFVYFYKPIL